MVLLFLEISRPLAMLCLHDGNPTYLHLLHVWKSYPLPVTKTKPNPNPNTNPNSTHPTKMTLTVLII